MKRILAATAAILMATSIALAEPASTTTAATASAVPAIAVTPTPSAAPTGILCETEWFTFTMPDRLKVMDESLRAGYDAAAQADYPDAGRTLLSAMDESGSAMLTFSGMESSQEALSAAKEAAADILGSDESVTELNFGVHSCAAFACSIEDQIYRLYYLSSGEKLVILGASGLEDAEISMILSSLTFL